MIPFKTYGNGDRLVHFAHANAYPIGCYTPFLSHFTHAYSFKAIESRPLWKDQKVSQLNNWQLFADDLIQFFGEQDLKGVVGMGHSMGAVYSLLAANKNPGMFRKLIMLDPVVLPQKFYKLIRLPFALKKRMLPMIKIASKRRDKWSNREEARAYFLSKKIFQRFEEQAFDAFIEYGLKEESGKVRLAYPREWEARVYGTATSIWHLLAKPPCPIVVVKAQHSDVITADTWQKWMDMSSDTVFFEMANVGHLMPFEKPRQLAQLINPYV